MKGDDCDSESGVVIKASDVDAPAWRAVLTSVFLAQACLFALATFIYLEEQLGEDTVLESFKAEGRTFNHIITISYY